MYRYEARVDAIRTRVGNRLGFFFDVIQVVYLLNIWPFFQEFHDKFGIKGNTRERKKMCYIKGWNLCYTKNVSLFTGFHFIFL